ncbi:MAG: hypothetical protein WAM28_07955 [Chlamydiales bacterium]
MSYPPPGYDDETVIAQRRLKLLLDQFEDDLSKIDAVFQQNLPRQFQVSAGIERDFENLSNSAAELGQEFSFLVEKLITDYRNFREMPDQEKLEKLFSDVKSLQLFLVS